MSECSGKDCTHESHKHELAPEQKEVLKGLHKESETLKEQAAGEARQNPIITPGDQERWPILEMSSKACSMPISSEDEEAIALMDALLNALDTEAAGLAAVQIGYPRRIFLLRNGTNPDGEAINNVYINPTITHKSKETKRDNEACLSLPHMYGRIARPKSVTLQYADLDGELHRETFSGFWARAVMHEMDHLKGSLIVKHIEKELSKQPAKTKFGMHLTPRRIKVIAKRRAKKKHAKSQRQHARASGR